MAQEQSRMLHHNFIGTEHLLLGLVDDDDGVAARVLSESGVPRAAIAGAVIDIVGSGSSEPAAHIPFTPRAKKVLELSLREALQLGHNYIGEEHILLGLIREGEGVAAQVLVSLGGDPSTIRAQVLKVLSDDDFVRPPEDTSADVEGGVVGELGASWSDEVMTRRQRQMNTGREGDHWRPRLALIMAQPLLVLLTIIAASQWPMPETALAVSGFVALILGVAALTAAAVFPVDVGHPPTQTAATWQRWRLATTSVAFGVAALLLLLDRLMS